MVNTSKKYTLVIHGGLGFLYAPAQYRASLQKVLRAGEKLLREGRSALDVVESCVKMLENDPYFNAGKGSVLNEDGRVEMDASIMDGATRRAGAVAAVTGIKNPVALARLVLKKSRHVLLVGRGAEQFGALYRVATAPLSYFVTPARVRQLAQARAPQSAAPVKDRKYGTVGAVARDTKGDLAAATSTGGLVNKQFGRVGDSPIVGAGVFADNKSCAVSCTGVGEDILRSSLAHTVASYVMFKRLGAAQAARAGIREMTWRIQGKAGLIVVDKKGGWAAESSSSGLLYGAVTEKRNFTIFQDR